jgi:hypothetical protein
VQGGRLGVERFTGKRALYLLGKPCYTFAKPRSWNDSRITAAMRFAKAENQKMTR